MRRIISCEREVAETHFGRLGRGQEPGFHLTSLSNAIDRLRSKAISN